MILDLIDITSEEHPKKIASVNAEHFVLGREPQDGIIFNHPGISGEHVKFVKYRQDWVVEDLGSTNGSWLNNKKLVPGAPYVLKPNDVLQLADTALKLQFVQDVNNRSLIVFKKGEYQSHFPIPEQGRALVIGGKEADVPIEGDDSNLAALIVERRGGKIYAYRQNEAHDVNRDGKPIGHMAELNNGSRIELVDFLVIYNDGEALAALGRRRANSGAFKSFVSSGAYVAPEGRQAQSARPKPPPAASQPQSEAPVRAPIQKTPSNPSFGHRRQEMESEMEELYTSGVYTPKRGSMSMYDSGELEPETFSLLEDRLILGLIALMFFVIFVLLVWWMFG